MRNKPTLVLVEMVILFLVFAIAAVLCLSAFFWAKETSKESFALDQAWIQAQSAAEVVKFCEGDFAAAAKLLDGTWDGEDQILCSGELDPEEKISYTLTITLTDSGVPALGQAEICVMQGDEDLVRLNTAWQEVAGHE
ncbi:MAG: hypothetical protein E7224_01580 [Clostridiales bacterium]|nr:hypothetical protein [Clostridiales bacterium]